MFDPLNFPDRPDHPDFWRISECVLQSDGAVSDPALDGDSDEAFLNLVARHVDLMSLQYMAQQRALRLIVDRMMDPEREEVYINVLCAVAWMDGFLAGACFQQHGGHRDA